MDLSNAFDTINHELVIEQLHRIAKWFEDNCMKLNSGKCHLFVSGNTYKHIWMMMVMIK